MQKPQPSQPGGVTPLGYSSSPNAHSVQTADESGPYGQNAAAASRDQHHFQQQQQQQQQQQPSGYHQKYPYGYEQSAGQPAPYGGDNGFTAVPVAAAPIVPIPARPLGLVVGNADGVDTYLLHPYRTLNVVSLCVNLAVVAICLLTLISGFSVVQVVFLVLASVFAVVLLVLTTRSQLEFDKGKREVRIVQQKLIKAFCGPDLVMMAPFSDLRDAGFDAPLGQWGDLYLLIGDTRYVVCTRMYNTEQVMYHDIEPWRRYVAELRGTDSNDIGQAAQRVMMMIVQTR